MPFDKNRFAILLEKAKGKERSINKYAKECDISSAHISRLIRGLVNTPPTPDTILRLSSVANNGVTYNELMNAAGYFDTNRNISQKEKFFVDVSGLPEEAITQIDEYIELIRLKYKKNKKF